MKIEKVISAFTADPTYMEFVEPMCLAWNKLYGIKPMVVYVKTGDDEIDDDVALRIHEISESNGGIIDLQFLQRVPTINYGIQGKISRLFLASEYKDTVNMIVDIDMIPLNKDLLGFAENVPDDHLVQFGYDHPSFQRQPDIGKWPMDKTTAHGTTFSEIINPKNLYYEELLNSWCVFPEDKRSNVFNVFSGFSDESLLRCLWSRWEHKEKRTTKIARKDVPCKCPEGAGLYGRLCRSSHATLSDVNIADFYEAHGPRPPSKNIEWYEPIFKYIMEL